MWSLQVQTRRPTIANRPNTTGKLDAARLDRLLKRYSRRKDRSVVVGPGVGLDAAAIKVKAGTLVVASDPVTYASEQLGYYAVHINANDIYVSGAKPRWFLADILLPPGQARSAEKIFRQMHQACAELNVSLIGGHTEMTPDLPRPMVAGFMIGELLGKKPITAAGVRKGDVIILTKGLAIEGTAVIARERQKSLAGKLPDSLLRRARGFLRKPGLSVKAEAVIAARHGVHALHDPTEGGLLNGLWEMSRACKLALYVDTDAIPVYPETKALCGRFGLDPLGLLASGALLIACPRRAAKNLCQELDAADIMSRVIGLAGSGSAGVHFKDGRVIREAVTDEILKVFDED